MHLKNTKCCILCQNISMTAVPSTTLLRFREDIMMVGCWELTDPCEHGHQSSPVDSVDSGQHEHQAPELASSPLR